MDIIGEFARRLFADVLPLLDWSLTNWAITIVVLLLMIFRAGKQRRVPRTR